jgi:hypothetical protein
MKKSCPEYACAPSAATLMEMTSVSVREPVNDSVAKEARLGPKNCAPDAGRTALLQTVPVGNPEAEGNGVTVPPFADADTSEDAGPLAPNGVAEFRYWAMHKPCPYPPTVGSDQFEVHVTVVLVATPPAIVNVGVVQLMDTCEAMVKESGTEAVFVMGVCAIVMPGNITSINASTSAFSCLIMVFILLAEGCSACCNPCRR